MDGGRRVGIGGIWDLREWVSEEGGVTRVWGIV